MSNEGDLSWLGFAVTMMREAPARIRYEKLKAENFRLKAENERLKCVVQSKHEELDLERQIRWEGNRITSEEHREEVYALRKQLDEARELLPMALEIIHKLAMGESLNGFAPKFELLTAWLEKNK